MRLYFLLYLLLLGSLLSFAEKMEVEEVEEDDALDDGIVDVEEEEMAAAKQKVLYERPVPLGRTHFHEPFDTRAEFLKRWVISQAKKDGAEEDVAKYDGKWTVEEPEDSPIINDLGLVLKTKAKHHAISAKLDEPFFFSDRPFIAQYEVRFQHGLDCGGAYIKLLSKPKDDSLNLKSFTDKTPYTIMFGPDKCGNDHKLHFIFRHRNPMNGQIEEKHAAKPTAKLDSYFSDRKTHLYTLMIRPDNTYEIKVDNNVVATGDLLNSFSPPVNPPKEIQDPNDKKPVEWDEREKIPDKEAKKPDDWDESEPATIVDENAVKPSGWLEDEEVYVPDPTAIKPDDWDDDMDGEWEAPRIDNPKCADAPGCGKWEPPTVPNPKYKGPWRPPVIDNPNYKGEWKPKIIPNPNYFEDKEPFKMMPIVAIGLELWSMSNNILFDNFIISDNETIVEEFTTLTWEVKNMQEKAAASSGSWWETIKGSADERPWLWAVYVMVILLPVVLLCICLCPTSGPIKPEDIAAHKKKFDDASPDTIPEEEEDDIAQQNVDADEKEELEENKGAGGDNEESDKQKEAADDESNGEQADEESDSKDGEGSPKKSSSPRRRKARKE